MSNYEIKRKYTVEVLNALPMHMRLDFDGAMRQWWMNFRKEGGLRLSEKGNTMFGVAQIEGYTFECKQNNRAWLAMLRDLNNKLICPYYLGKISITIYDSKAALMVSLYGDIFSYIDSLS